MNLFLRILVCLLFSLPIVSAAATQGTISQGRYESPFHNFSISLPDWPGLKVEDRSGPAESGRVSFTGDFADLWAITYQKLLPGDLPLLTVPEQRDALYGAFVKSYYMPNLALRASPQSAIVYEKPIEVGNMPAYFAVIRIPGMSSMMQKGKRLDSVRGLMVFARNGYIYSLEHEMNTLIDQIKLGPLDPSAISTARIEASQQSLKKILDSIVFQ